MTGYNKKYYRLNLVDNPRGIYIMSATLQEITMFRKLCFIAVLTSCATIIPTARAADKPAPKKTVGVSLLAATNPFFVDMGNAIKAEAAKHGMEVIITSADFDVAKQKNQVSDF